MMEHNAAIPQDQRIEFRIGINLGDVIVEDGDIHGDGVNVAARLEAIAEPGSICASAVVYDQVRGRVDCAFDDLGKQSLRNIALPVRVYRSRLPNQETRLRYRSIVHLSCRHRISLLLLCSRFRI
jgi:adenylate cyclase